MEGLRMDYRFTAILIIMLTMLTFFAEPAYPRNEYLNEYGARCGDFETRVEAITGIKTKFFLNRSAMFII